MILPRTNMLGGYIGETADRRVREAWAWFGTVRTGKGFSGSEMTEASRFRGTGECLVSGLNDPA